MISLYRRLSKLRWRENDWYHIVPFGDVHRRSPDHDSQRYHKFLKRCAEREDTLVVGLGDYDDPMSTSERKHWKAKDWHGGTEYDYEKHVFRSLNEHIDLLAPLAATGRLLGLSEGHHYYTFQCEQLWRKELRLDEFIGKSTTEYMCSKLGVPYLGMLFLMSVAIPNARKGTHDLNIKIWGHHGDTIGGKDKGMNTLRNLVSYWDADCYFMGHNHRKAVDRDTIGGYLEKPKGQADQALKWHHRLRVMARTGAFLRSYNESSRPSYQEVKHFPPSDLGVVNVAVSWKREQVNGVDRTWLDMHPSL